MKKWAKLQVKIKKTTLLDDGMAAAAAKMLGGRDETGRERSQSR